MQELVVTHIEPTGSKAMQKKTKAQATKEEMKVASMPMQYG
jgi:hypothetical protein